jgi:hypothetical protein
MEESIEMQMEMEKNIDISVGDGYLADMGDDVEEFEREAINDWAYNGIFITDADLKLDDIYNWDVSLNLSNGDTVESFGRGVGAIGETSTLKITDKDGNIIEEITSEYTDEIFDDSYATFVESTLGMYIKHKKI